jgi:hypothetical protein
MFDTDSIIESYAELFPLENLKISLDQVSTESEIIEKSNNIESPLLSQIKSLPVELTEKLRYIGVQYINDFLEEEGIKNIWTYLSDDSYDKIKDLVINFNPINNSVKPAKTTEKNQVNSFLYIYISLFENDRIVEFYYRAIYFKFVVKFSKNKLNEFVNNFPINTKKILMCDDKEILSSLDLKDCEDVYQKSVIDRLVTKKRLVENFPNSANLEILNAKPVLKLVSYVLIQ